MTKPNKFTIDRKTWHRGKGGVGSALLTGEGNRCCLGFVGSQCGLTDEEMFENSVLDMCANYKEFPEFLWTKYGFCSDICGKLMYCNDSVTTSDAFKEEFIIKTFAEHGYEVEFVN